MTDVLAPVEKLLADVLWDQHYSCGACDPAEGPRCTCGNDEAREAVRLLLALAEENQEWCDALAPDEQPKLFPALHALYAFACQLETEEETC